MPLEYPFSTPMSRTMCFIEKMKVWRRGWDSNPRLSFPNTRFRGELLQPLGHLSAS
jgi:hypothetical protein